MAPVEKVINTPEVVLASTASNPRYLNIIFPSPTSSRKSSIWIWCFSFLGILLLCNYIGEYSKTTYSIISIFSILHKCYLQYAFSNCFFQNQFVWESQLLISKGSGFYIFIVCSRLLHKHIAIYVSVLSTDGQDAMNILIHVSFLYMFLKYGLVHRHNANTWAVTYQSSMRQGAWAKICINFATKHTVLIDF